MKKILLLLTMCFLALTALAGEAPVGEQRLGLGDLRNLPIGTEVTMGYNATVLYVDYKVIFLEDETGYAAINVDRVSFNDGDVIAAGYVVKVGGNFNFTLPQAEAVSGFQRADEVHQPNVEEVTISQINGGMLGHLVVLRNVVLNAMNRTLRDDSGRTIGVYQTFAFPAVEGYVYEESDPEDWYVIVVNGSTVYLTHNVHYYGLGYDYGGLPDSTEVRLRFNATVLYQHGNWLYAKDRTGYGLLYGPTNRTYLTGDVIPPEYHATKTIADGEVRLMNPRNMRNSSSEHLTVEPEEVTVEEINHEHWAHYVALTDVDVSDLNGDRFVLMDAQGNQCLGQNTFEQPLQNGHYDVLQGIVGSHTAPDGQIEYQLLPILSADTAEVRTIAEFLSHPAGEYLRFSEPLTAIYQNGMYLYVRDCEGGEMLVYGQVEDSFANGDVITGAVARWSNERLTPAVMYHEYYGPLLIPVSGWTVSGHNEPVEPIKADIQDIDEGLLHHYVYVPNVKRYVSNSVWDGADYNWILNYDNEFNIELPDWDRSKTYDVVGFVSYYYPSHWRVYPVEIKEHVYVAMGDVNEDGQVNISDLNQVLECILGHCHGYVLRHSDVNGDGEVNISDVNSIVDVILKN